MPFRTRKFIGTPLLGLFLAVILTACSKKEEAAAETTGAAAAQPPPEVAAQIEAQVPTKNPNATTIQERMDGAVHPQFTALLHRFVDTFGRMPESFNELAART